jgi:putative ATP-binding cassette transporter
MNDGAALNNRTALIYFRQYLGVIRASSSRWKIAAFAASIALILVFTAIGQIRLNQWQGAFYDAVSKRNFPGFLTQIAVFAAVVSVLLVLGVAQTWLHQTLRIRLRQIITGNLLEEWLRPRRAYRLSLAGEIGANPDQRLHDDARRLAELTADLSVGLLQSGLLLFSFIGVLWRLSPQVTFVSGGEPFVIPGYMVWCALAYALTGSWLASVVGNPLIRRNAELRAREAEFRFALVRASEKSREVAIYGGEAGERTRLNAALNGAVVTACGLVNNLTRLTWITAGYGWVALVAPIVVAAPGYFRNTMSFGDLMIAVGAFMQVQQSLRWYVDNYAGVAELKAVLLRVIVFRDAIRTADGLGADVGLIKYEEHPEGRLELEGLSVLAPHGRIIVDGARVEAAPGDRLQIIGEARSGKSTFFHALAGLWPWGTGVIRMPERRKIMFLPHRPYIPLGTLRAALTYPAPSRQFDDETILAALDRLGLSRLAPALDQDARWDKELSVDEQQRVAYVRALLHRPQWVIQDEALSELDPAGRAQAYSIFDNELRGTAVISIGHDHVEAPFFDRTLTLRAEPPGLELPLRFDARGREASRTAVTSCAQT